MASPWKIIKKNVYIIITLDEIVFFETLESLILNLRAWSSGPIIDLGIGIISIMYLRASRKAQSCCFFTSQPSVIIYNVFPWIAIILISF